MFWCGTNMAAHRIRQLSAGWHLCTPPGPWCSVQLRARSCRSADAGSSPLTKLHRLVSEAQAHTCSLTA